MIGIGDATNIFQTVALVYLAWQQNQIFKQQNEIFAKQGGRKPMTPSRVGLSLWLRRYWPTLTMVVAIGLSGYDIYDRHHPRTVDWGHYKFTQVRGKHLSNQVVVLDGHEYVDCVFENVTLEYDGTAPARATRVSVVGTRKLHVHGHSSLMQLADILTSLEFCNLTVTTDDSQ